MKNTRMLLHAGAMLLLCAAVAVGQQKVTLGYKFVPGKAYLYADSVSSQQTQEMGGQEMKIVTSAIMSSRIVGEKVAANGVMSVITSADAIVLSVKAPGRDTTMSLPDFVGKRTRLTVTPEGTVKSRETIDTVQVKGMMGSMAPTRETLRFHRFSKDPVAVGGTWKGEGADTTEMMGGKLISRAKTDYSVLGAVECRGHACLQISYKGEVVMEGKGSMMGMEIFMEGKGKVSGVLFFDAANGVVVQESSATDTDMTAAVTGQQSMTIPITAAVKVSRALVNIEGGTK
jgi:hypothetical protein